MALKIWLRHADPGERLDPKIEEAGEKALRRVLPFRRDRLGDDIAAVDAVEEVVRTASKFAVSIRDPYVYILTSAMRRLKRMVKRTPATTFVEPAKLEELISTDRQAQIDAKLMCDKIRSQLPERDFAFLMSVVAEDSTWEQVGAAMGLSADAARKKYDRLIKSIREGLLHDGKSERQ